MLSIPIWIPIWIPIVVGLIGLGGAILVAILTVRLTLGRFRSERWWDRKADSYTKIVEGLYMLHKAFELQASGDWRLRGKMTEEEEKKATDALYEKWAKTDAAEEELKRVTALGSFTASDSVAAYLKKFSERKKPDISESRWDFWASEATAYKDAFEEVKRLALKDLGIGRRQ